MERLSSRLSLLYSLTALFCLADLQAQVQWSNYAGNPVMDFGPSGSWDRGLAFLPAVIKSSDTLRMWYSGGAVSQSVAAAEIGYAWSLDGLDWTRYGGNPVLPKRPGEWDAGGTAGSVVIQDGDTLRMWYVGYPLGIIGPNGGSIGYATSVDGINWNRLSAPVLERGAAGEWDSELLDLGTIIKVGTTFKMWYSGGVGNFPLLAKINTGYATSTDGIQWLKYDDPSTTAAPFQFSDPVLPRGAPGSWDATRAWTAKVCATASGYELWYAGESPTTGNLQVIGYATSTDGISWTKYSGNPVLQPSGTWTNDLLPSSLMLDGGQYRMWFTGFQKTFPYAGRIGYATAPVTGIGDQRSDVASEFKLEQNYPNPFNPTTVISYHLPAGQVGLPVVSDVRLVVYDLLGREVAVLVNEKKAPGSYSVRFDATGPATGVYLYRLVAGGYAECRKMLLVR